MDLRGDVNARRYADTLSIHLKWQLQVARSLLAGGHKQALEPYLRQILGAIRTLTHADLASELSEELATVAAHANLLLLTAEATIFITDDWSARLTRIGAEIANTCCGRVDRDPPSEFVELVVATATTGPTALGLVGPVLIASHHAMEMPQIEAIMSEHDAWIEWLSSQKT
jgi:hypothetical protein